MSEFQYDLAVAYRIYPKVSSKPPPIFADDKYKLAELCLESFKRSTTGLRIKLFVLFNDCPPSYEKLFTDRWAREDLEFLRFPGVPAGTTLHEQARILAGQRDAQIVFFAEDDYFFLPGQFPLALEFLRRNPDADFLSPYDHPDIYSTDIHRINPETRSWGGKEWRSCMSTTHTFLAKREVLVENRNLFLKFGGPVNHDLAMWMALTKRRVLNPVRFLLWIARRKLFWAGSVFNAWRYFGKQIVFGRRYKLWVPRPAIATHMLAGLESPDVNWQEEFRKQGVPRS